MCHRTLQNTYYIRSHYQDTESKHLYLIHRNKQREAAKVRRQRNMAQMKELIKTPEEELNEMDISNLSDAEFQTQVGSDLRLYHPGYPRARLPSRQVQAIFEHHHPAPAQLILHGGGREEDGEGWRLMVRSHSQSLQLTGLGKSLPLTCQQHSRLNYKRRVHPAHTEGAP